jgi:uncharacterized protein (TIGR02147 family)
MQDPRNFLKTTLEERIASNPNYSMRAFARDLMLSPQQLSNVLSGQRGMSDKTADLVGNRLGLTQAQKEIFCQGVRAEFSRSKPQRIVAKAKLASLNQKHLSTVYLELDVLKTVSNWYHFALIGLLKMPKPKSKSATSWFSEKLGISENETKSALMRLERLGLISKTAVGWKVNSEQIVVDKGIPTEGVRAFHRQVLEKATEALAFQSQDERYGYSLALPVKVKNLDRAKQLIQEFREKFSNEIADQKNADEVYGLSVQYFRLTQPVQRDQGA